MQVAVPRAGLVGRTSFLTRPGPRVLAGALLTVLVLLVLARLADLEALGLALAAVPARGGDVAVIALVYSLAFALRAVVWRCLLRTPVGIGRLFSILQTALLANHLLPFKAGELIRPYLAARSGSPAGEAAASTLVARLLDLAALALIAGVAASILGIADGILPAVAASAALIAVTAAAAVALVLHGERFVPRALRPIAMEGRQALARVGLRRASVLLPVVIASWVLEAAVLLGAAGLMGMDVSPGLAVAATAFAIMFQVVHLTPGGIGVYEAGMASVLVLGGIPAQAALTLALLTHGLKFAYSFTVALPFAVTEGLRASGTLRGARARTAEPRGASVFEIGMARAWNVVNEGKPFTPAFALGVIGLLSVPRLGDARYAADAAMSLLALVPLGVLFWRFDFPLHLRRWLWAYLAVFVVAFQAVSLPAAVLVVSLYLLFTVFIWGTLYYHLRIGTSWTNFLRFWRLVAEDPDPTSGNLQEQLPKLLVLVLAFEWLVAGPSADRVVALQAFAAVVGITALLAHQWGFNWVPALPQWLPARAHVAPARTSRRVIVIAIDGCRADRLREARTPFLDQLRAEGTEYTNMATVYPARTVTCFSSMLTGASPRDHGMRSNFVPSLGVKCESLFDVLERHGMRGRLVGIAHLIDAFGHEAVRTVTSVMHNDEIDAALVDRAKRLLLDEDPELLVLQLLSLDQTGHARGSYNGEYLAKIEETDRTIRDFVAWCRSNGFLDGATLIVTSDHGQGIGIGGHGHMTPTEILVPCVLWGEGVPAGGSFDELRFVTDIAPMVSGFLGVPEPARSVGVPLLPRSDGTRARPLVFVIPAYNEAERLPRVLRAIATAKPGAAVVVVDDGSRDGTADAAASHGAVVVRHERNRGLGAALRTGIARARELDARAAVYIDADGEYDAAETDRLLLPIERGEADYVLGSRFSGTVDGMPLRRRIANAAFSLLLSATCGRWITDGQTGFRAFSRRALDVAEVVHDYNYAQVLTLDLLRKGMRLAEVPIRYRRRTSGRSFISGEYLWRVPLGMAREMLGD
ncbi:MAG: lysylphosphatidylglycerol synthase domain-containing protein [Candidatus Limnocylindria bacterium]